MCTTRHPSGTDSPGTTFIYSLLSEWMNEAWQSLPMMLPDNYEAQQQIDRCCGASTVSHRLQQTFDSRRAGRRPSRAWLTQKSPLPWLFHLCLPSCYFSWVYMPLTPWVIRLWKKKQLTFSSKLFSSKFRAKIVNSVLGVEWDRLTGDRCQNRHRMHLYKGKKITLSCKTILGLHRVICTHILLVGGFAINDYSWTNRRTSFYHDCAFSQIISVACKNPTTSGTPRIKGGEASGVLRPTTHQKNSLATRKPRRWQ